MNETTRAVSIGRAAPPAVQALPDLDARLLSAHTAQVNEAFGVARDAYLLASQALGEMLTEQVSRHVLDLFPAARAIEISTVPVPCRCPLDWACPGHGRRLLPGALLNAAGAPIGSLDPLDPVLYWTERLSQIVDPFDGLLDVVERRWLPIG